MGDISRFTSTIAASVEEQSASTQEIGRNVHEAATGANELAGNMATVTEAIDETNRSATHVLDASSALTAQAGTLAAGGGRVPRPGRGGLEHDPESGNRFSEGSCADS